MAEMLLMCSLTLVNNILEHRPRVCYVAKIIHYELTLIFWCQARQGTGKVYDHDFGLRNWYSTAGLRCTAWYSKSWSVLALRPPSRPLKVTIITKAIKLSDIKQY